MIVVVGGGIAGLATARALVVAGCPVPVTVLERDARFGGKIRTERIGGYLLEGGPESLLSQKPWGVSLARELGLTLLPTRQENSGVFVWCRRRLQPVPEGFTLMVPTRIGPFVRTPLISPWGKLRMAMDWFIPPRREETDESLGAFVRRRLGSEVLERVAEPMMAGIYAADADELSLQCTFPRFIDMERKHGSLVRAALKMRTAPQSDLTPFVSFAGGLQELVDALQADLVARGVTLLSGVTVEAITADGVRLGGGETLTADAVVLAAPAFEASGMVEGLDPELSRHLAQLPYETSATVTAAWRVSAVRHPLKGFGFVVPRRERRQVLACTWTSSKWSQRAPQGMALLRAYTAGPSLAQQSDDQLRDAVLSELRDMLGTEGPPAMCEVRRLTRSTPHYRVGHLAWVERAETLAAGHPGLFLTGSSYRGVGIPDCIREGGETAKAVMRHIKREGT